MNRTLVWIVLFAIIGCSDSLDTRLQRFLMQGNEMVTLRNPEQAEKFYREALALDSCFADAWNNLGTLYFNQQKFSEAVGFYDRAIECRPGYIDAYLNRANATYETKEYFSSLADLDKVVARKPDTAVVYFVKGLVLTKLQRFDDALTEFRKAKTIDETNVDIIVNEGTLFYYKTQYDSASYFLNLAINTTAGKADAYNVLALIQIEQQKYPEAAVNIEHALSIRPRDPFFLNNRGYLHLMVGDLAQAKEDIDNSISIDPYNAWAYRNKGIYYLKAKQYDDAVRVLEQAESLDPFIDKIYITLAEAYIQVKNYDKACRAYEKSVERGEIGNTTMKPCK